MVEHVVGMQAQAPLAPYVALWSRLEGFDPGVLSGLIESRAAVRAIALMRGTIHLVTADDAIGLRRIMQATIERQVSYRGPLTTALAGLDRPALLDTGRAALAARPMTTTQLAAELAPTWPDRDALILAIAIRDLVPVVQVPPRGLWGRTGKPTIATTEGWLGRPGGLADAASARGSESQRASAADLERLVVRYLAAFGPATVADMQAWSWLTGLREVVERLRPSLRTFRDERGRELFDVPDGVLADPETPAPPRFLPEYDNLILSHRDRSRVLPPERRPPQGFGDGARMGSVLVDGFVAGTWRLEGRGSRPKTAITLAIQPWARLPALDVRALASEAARLLELLAPDDRATVRIDPPDPTAHLAERG
jgi:hypothetical protein